MDSTNCSAGYATDQFLLYGSDFQPNSCDAPYAVVIGVFTALLTVRISINLLQLQVWLRRERLSKENPKKIHNSSRRRRLPLVPMVSLSQTIFMGLFFILGVTNVANSKNGVSLFLFQMYFVPLSIVGQVFALRIITLGKRLLPLTAPAHAKDGKTSVMHQRLDRKSIAMQVLLFLANVSNVVALFTSIVGMFIPSIVMFQIVCSCYFIVDYFVMAAFGYQYERVIWAVRACQDSSNNIKNRDRVENAIRRLRVQQLVCSVLYPITSITWILLATRTVPAYYWMVLVAYAGEMFCAAVSIGAFTTGCNARNEKSSPSDQAESAVESANIRTNLKVMSSQNTDET